MDTAQIVLESHQPQAHQPPPDFVSSWSSWSERSGMGAGELRAGEKAANPRLELA